MLRMSRLPAMINVMMATSSTTTTELSPPGDACVKAKMTSTPNHKKIDMLNMREMRVNLRRQCRRAVAHQFLHLVKANTRAQQPGPERVAQRVDVELLTRRVDLLQASAVQQTIEDAHRVGALIPPTLAARRQEDAVGWQGLETSHLSVNRAKLLQFIEQLDRDRIHLLALALGRFRA